MLAIFDVEGVLLDAEFLPILAEKINKQDEIWEITRKGIEGTIKWEEGLRKRIELLRGIDYETCKEVADSLKVMTGASEVKLFEICGLGVAFRAQDIVKDLATVTLEEKDLSKLIDLINTHYGLKIQTQTIA